MKVFLITSALLVWLAIGCSVAAAAGESSFPDIQRILDNGRIRVAVLAEDAPPMIMTSDTGALTGSEADLARNLGARLGVDVEFIRTATTYDGVVDIVARKEADIAVSFLSSGVRRATLVLFSQPYVTQNRRVFFNRALFAALRRDHGIDSIAQLANTDIAGTLVFGVLADSINEQMLRKYLPQFAVKRYRDLPSMVTAVKQGEIFAGLHGELQLNYYMRRNPETAIYIGFEPRARHPSDICIAVRPDAPNLLRWVNVFLSNHVGLMDSDEIVERYITPRTR